MQRTLRTLDDTRSLARELSEVLGAGDVLALSGDLGAGKTTLVKALAACWGLEEAAVCSPTFALIDVHALSDFDLVHADLYRMEDEDELVSSGLLDYLADPQCLVAMEWPELAERLLPAETVRVHLSLAADGVRIARIDGLGDA